jgi:thiamine pyrophosphokinase
MQRIIIFANGEIPNLENARSLLHAGDYLICADGGARHALALGLKPHLVIGDMDSIDKEQLQELKNAGVSIELFPRDKNETDLELALARAIELEPKALLIIGALGGRLDQTFGNTALLSDARLAAINIRLDDGLEEIFFCRDQGEVRGRSRDVVSLIPWGNPVQGVQTQGLKWPLQRETLFPEKTRGISNEMTGEVASIKIASGLLLVIHRRES